MGKHKSYNGHKNHAAWNINLWFENNEGLYNMAKEAMRRTNTLDLAAERLIEALEGQSTPDGVKYTKTNIRLALRGL